MWQCTDSRCITFRKCATRGVQLHFTQHGIANGLWASSAVRACSCHVSSAFKIFEILGYSTSIRVCEGISIKIFEMSSAEPALPWGVQADDDAGHPSQETGKPADLKKGQRIRVSQAFSSMHSLHSLMVVVRPVMTLKACTGLVGDP